MIRPETVSVLSEEESRGVVVEAGPLQTKYFGVMKYVIL